MVVLLTSLLLTSLVAWPAAPIHGVRAAAAAVVMLEGKAPPLKLLNLMCQCTVQAQLGYYAEFKNEVRSRWLESFLGHEHLRVERTGAMTTRLLYRGLSDGMRCSWRDYLATMLRGKPEQYEVRYAVGTADAATMPRVPRPEQPPDDVATEAAAAAPAAAEGEAPSTQAAAASAGSAEAAKAAWLARSDGRAPAATPPPSSAKPWAAASASRAANPFLLKADRTYLEYTELLEPRRIATGLISIAQQLAHEWSEDLAHLTREGDYLSEVYASEAGSCIVNSVGGDDAPPATLMSELGSTAAAARDVSKALPSILYASLSVASAAWVSDLNEAGISPFRAENYDLLQRALTREAALSALAELEQARAAPAFPVHPRRHCACARCTSACSHRIPRARRVACLPLPRHVDYLPRAIPPACRSLGVLLPCAPSVRLSLPRVPVAPGDLGDLPPRASPRPVRSSRQRAARTLPRPSGCVRGSRRTLFYGRRRHVTSSPGSLYSSCSRRLPRPSWCLPTSLWASRRGWASYTRPRSRRWSWTSAPRLQTSGARRCATTYPARYRHCSPRRCRSASRRTSPSDEER